MGSQRHNSMRSHKSNNVISLVEKAYIDFGISSTLLCTIVTQWYTLQQNNDYNYGSTFVDYKLVGRTFGD